MAHDNDNHNFITDTGYKIYRPDGSLRTSFFTDNRPHCEGTFSVEVKDLTGKVKSYEEHPVRSFQGGFINDYLANATTSTKRMANYPYKITPDSSGGRTSLVSTGDLAYHGGIFIGNISNKNSGYFGRTFNANGIAHNSVEPYITYSVTAPHYDTTSHAIVFAMARSTIPLNSGFANGVGFMTRSSESATQYYTWFCDACASSWAALDSIKVTYNFAFPSTPESTVTKNLILDMFGWVYTGLHLKNSEDQDVDVRRSTTSSYAFASAAHIYGAAQNQVDRGIVLGESDLDVTWEDAHLNSPISADRLRPDSESSSDFIGLAVADNATKCYCTHARTFTNISNEDITIREAGVYAYSNDTTYSVTAAGSFLIAHWLTGDIVIHPGEAIRVYWKPTIISD